MAKDDGIGPDRGIKAVWYDLAEDGRDDYLDWLHGTELPRLAARDGILWAAHYRIAPPEHWVSFHDRMNRTTDPEVGQGTQYILALGAADPHLFFSDDAPLDDSGNGEMADRRLQARACVFAEVARILGPEAASRAPGAAPGPAVQFGSFQTRKPEQEFDISQWYARYRLPAVAHMPGVVAARRLACIAGWPKHAVIYEFTALDTRLANFQPHESKGEVDGEWTNRVALDFTFHSPGSPSVAERIWPA